MKPEETAGRVVKLILGTAITMVAFKSSVACCGSSWGEVGALPPSLHYISTQPIGQCKIWFVFDFPHNDDPSVSLCHFLIPTY